MPRLMVTTRVLSVGSLPEVDRRGGFTLGQTSLTSAIEVFCLCNLILLPEVEKVNTSF
jgi:hypothetical protein